MQRLIGASCLAAAVMLAGREKTRAVRAETERVRRLRDGVASLRTMVLFRRLRLAECFSALPQDRLFSALSQSVAEKPGEKLTVLFSAALKTESSLPERAKQTFLSLAPALESADTASQEQAFALAGEELNALLTELEASSAVRCREIRTVCTCAGLALAILLL